MAADCRDASAATGDVWPGVIALLADPRGLGMELGMRDVGIAALLERIAMGCGKMSPACQSIINRACFITAPAA